MVGLHSAGDVWLFFWYMITLFFFQNRSAFDEVAGKKNTSAVLIFLRHPVLLLKHNVW